MANITLLPSAKVPLVYEGENTMTTEWYRFFWNIYGFTGTGVVPVNKGGTGLDTIGDHQLIIGNANNVFEPALLSSASIAITYPAGFINLELGTSGVTPGTYGSASQVGVFTVNAYGVLTAASNTSIGIDASQIISGTLPVIRGGTGQSTYTDGQLLIGDSTGNTLTKATLTAGTGISVTNGAGSITIANTGVLSVSGTAPVVSSGGATPAISMAAANTTTDGYLTSTDWNTFNNKAPATSGTSILYGNGTGGFSNVTIGSGISFAGGTLSATGSGGTVTSVSGTAPISVATGTTTPVISISQATTSTDGYLSSTDWNTFNNKQPAGAYLTAVTADAPLSGAGTSASHLVISQANTTTDGYLSSTDWNTFNNKQPAGTYVTSISIASSNGFTGTSSGGATPSLTLATSVTGILKGNGTAISAATSGTDYAPATSGTSILYGNGAGGFSNVTIGTGVSFVGGTLSATGTGGTVTSVAALTLGTTGTDLSSTVANSTTTPVITLNVPTASATNRGVLSAADWTTFNSKANAFTYTTNYVPYGQGTTTPTQSSAFQFNGTTLTLANDALINGVTAGKGGSSLTESTAFGNRSLESVTSGTGNSGFGYLSLLSVSTGTSNSAFGAYSQISGVGSQNTSVGYSALNNVSGNENTGVGSFAGGTGALSGEGNTCVGTSAGRNLSTGTANSFFGRGAGRSTTTGNINVAIGSDYPGYYAEAALQTNATGIGNVAIGNSALRLATSNYNVAIGLSAGTNVTTGNALTYIGTFASGSATTNTNEIVIGYGATGNGSNTATIGNSSITANYFFGSGKFGTTVGVGAATPSASGAGITFPATQSASTDANTLDDYEEGTWTPNQGSGITVVGTFSSVGSYTKIGNNVTIYAKLISTTSIACSATGILSSNLPFTAAATIIGTGATFNASLTSKSIGFVNAATTSMYSFDAISSATSIYFSATYSTN